MSKIFAAININAKNAGLDDESQRDRYEVLTGKRSLRAMNKSELFAVADDFKKLASPKAAPSKKWHPAPERNDLKLIHVLWGLLGNAGVLKRPNRDGLNAFIRARFEKKWGAVPVDVDGIREHSHISDVIDALKDWCRRECVELDQ